MSPRSRRVLVISYHFPPAPGVASMRLGNLVRHLPAHGWEYDVVAGPVGDVSDETMADGIRLERVRNVNSNRRRPLLQRADWAAAIGKSAYRLARDADAVLISGGPFAPFTLGPLLRRPYVLDFRDAWSWEPRFGRFDRRPRRRLGLAVERLGEAMALRGAAAVVTVSPGITDEYRRRYPRLDGRIETLRHCWEPLDFEERLLPSTAPPELVYAGSFLANERTPALLLQTAQLVRQQGIPLRVRLLGSLPPELRGQTSLSVSEGWLEVSGVVSHRAAVSALRRASVLWLQLDDLPFLIPGKVYEYLAAGPPIVAVAPAGGALATLLGEAGGAIVVDGSPSACAEAVTSALAGALVPRREDVVSKLATPALATSLAAILDRVAV